MKRKQNRKVGIEKLIGSFMAFIVVTGKLGRKIKCVPDGHTFTWNNQ